MTINNRIPSLDGFRTISIMIVILSHFIKYSIPANLQYLFDPLNIGDLGVRMFFVISGFLITFLLLKEKAKTGTVNLRAFYIRRFLRIFPVFYFYLFILSLLNHFLQLQIPLLVFVSGCLYIQNFAPWGGHWYISHSWSLAVEEQFYLLWPAIFMRSYKLTNFPLLIIVLLSGCIMRIIAYKYPEYSSFLLAPFLKHADFLFSGCYIAHLVFYKYELVVSIINKLHPSIVYVAILALWFFSKFETHPIYDKALLPVAGTIINISVCFLILYFVLRKESLGFKLLNLPSITFIGQLSYSLYVWQQLFISGYGYWWSEFPMNIIFTFLTAYCSYQFIEKPFLGLKERFNSSMTPYKISVTN